MKRKKKKISKQTISYILIGLLLIAITTLFGIGAFMSVIEIRVEGASMYSEDEVIEASGISRGDNLLFLSASNVSQRIESSMPFVTNAEVTRVFPDAVIITIEEGNAIATIRVGADIAVIDVNGRVLDYTVGGAQSIRDLARFDELIEVRGVVVDRAELGEIAVAAFGSEMNLAAMQDVLAAIVREGIAQDVSYIDVSNITSITMGYLDLYRVLLGGLTNVRPNLSRLQDTAAAFMMNHPNISGEINMTDPSGYVRFVPSH